VLSTKEFAAFAKDNLVLVEVDFPNFKTLPDKQKQANNALAQKFEIKVFPTIVVLDSDGKQLLKEEGYAGAGAKEYIAKLLKLKPS
jgi:protein disulfide-isomerase